MKSINNECRLVLLFILSFSTLSNAMFLFRTSPSLSALKLTKKLSQRAQNVKQVNLNRPPMIRSMLACLTSSDTPNLSFSHCEMKMDDLDEKEKQLKFMNHASNQSEQHLLPQNSLPQQPLQHHSLSHHSLQQHSLSQHSLQQHSLSQHSLPQQPLQHHLLSHHSVQQHSLQQHPKSHHQSLLSLVPIDTHLNDVFKRLVQTIQLVSDNTKKYNQTSIAKSIELFDRVKRYHHVLIDVKDTLTLFDTTINRPTQSMVHNFIHYLENMHSSMLGSIDSDIVDLLSTDEKVEVIMVKEHSLHTTQSNNLLLEIKHQMNTLKEG